MFERIDKPKAVAPKPSSKPVTSDRKPSRPLEGVDDLVLFAHAKRGDRGANAELAERGFGNSAIGVEPIPFATPHLRVHASAPVVQPLCAGGAACECERCTVQTKRSDGQAGDAYEREADAVADAIEGGATARPALDAHAAPMALGADRAPLGESFEAPLGGGVSLSPEVRAYFEPRFGSDFGGVRVHTDEEADASARALGAVAYTAGRDLYFAHGFYQPSSDHGRWVLAHELSHVVQQGAGGEPRAADASARDGAEREAERGARAVALGGAASVSAGRLAPTVLPLSEAAFRAGLGSTPQQAAAIDALFSDASFMALWSYLRACTATPAQDLGPLALLVTPHLMISGVERFGGYFGLTRTLNINPTKPEHVANPQELVDTIVHETIHAVFALQSACVAAGSGPAPRGGAATG